MAPVPKPRPAESAPIAFPRAAPESVESLTRKVRPPRSAKWVALFSALSPVVLLLIWEALARLGWLDRHFFPAPSAVLTFLWADLAGGQLLVDVAATLRRVVVGFAMGGIPAVILGLLLGMSRPLRMFLSPIFATLFSV